MRFAARMAVTTACAASFFWSAGGMAMGGMGGGAGFPGPGVAVMVPPTPPVVEPAPVSPYCATSARACVLRHPAAIGAPCACRVSGGRTFGTIVAQ
jgi:hypothetical protein